jgi:hypothetical protein
MGIGITPVNPTSRRSQTIPGLVRRLATELSKLFRQELTLATGELLRSLSLLLRGTALLACAAAALFAGLLLLLMSSVLVLATVLPMWMAALILGLVSVLLGCVVLLIARKQFDPVRLIPKRSSESLRRDKAVLTRKIL